MKTLETLTAMLKTYEFAHGKATMDGSAVGGAPGWMIHELSWELSKICGLGVSTSSVAEPPVMLEFHDPESVPGDHVGRCWMLLQVLKTWSRPKEGVLYSHAALGFGSFTAIDEPLHVLVQMMKALRIVGVERMEAAVWCGGFTLLPLLPLPDGTYTVDPGDIPEGHWLPDIPGLTWTLSGAPLKSLQS